VRLKAGRAIGERGSWFSPVRETNNPILS